MIDSCCSAWLLLGVFHVLSLSAGPEQGPRGHFQTITHTIWNSKLGTGCSLNIVFFSKILKHSGLWPFSVFPQCHCVSHTRQVEHQGCSITGRVQKKIKGKNTIFNEHPVIEIKVCKRTKLLFF